MKSPDDEYSDGLEAELRQFSLALQQANTAYLTVKVENTVQVAELESLRKENAALLVALVAKDAMLEKIACVGNGNSHGNSVGNCMAIEALAILPSTELLEARDRKRDAKLIGLLSDGSAMSPTSRSWMLRQAVNRESGEWVPELGD